MYTVGYFYPGHSIYTAQKGATKLPVTSKVDMKTIALRHVEEHYYYQPVNNELYRYGSLKLHYSFLLIKKR